MNKIFANLKSALKAPLMVLLACISLLACDSMIYDDEGDCSVHYTMKFVYDKNMKWADAFASEVKSVRLYAFNAEGNMIWQKTESGTHLAEDDYKMTIDLPAGKYHFVAWAGLDNEDSTEKHFTLAGGRSDNQELTLTDLTCTMNRNKVNGKAVSDKRLDPLFHGMADIELIDAEFVGGTYEYKMPLTKNTNHVRIILQHLSGEDVDVNDFSFSIEEGNGIMAHDNSLLDDEIITYLPHDTQNGIAGFGIDDYPELGADFASTDDVSTITSINVAVADMTIARMMADRRTYLSIHTDNGTRLVARIPLVDYALMLKNEYSHRMTDQEYLDRQDEYALTFFLDHSQKWIGTSIIINSWKVVINNVDFN